MTSITNYRSREVSDSDSSSSSDDDQPWKRQKRKRNEKVRVAPMAVSRPLQRPPPRPGSGTSGPNKRKRNNIWGEVVQAQEEEQVARDITQFDMHQNRERDVESYSYHRCGDVERKPQPLGNPVTFGDSSDLQNRKMPAALGGSNEDSWLVDEDKRDSGGPRIRDRLGPRSEEADSGGAGDEASFSPTMKAVTIEPDMHKKEVAGQMAYSLQEQNREMVKTVVHELGTEKSIAVWKETCDIERNGGMMVNTGRRRRTPGGVFFYLLKMDPDIPREKKDVIFAVSKLKAKQESKDKRRKRRRNKQGSREDKQGGKAESMEVEAKQGDIRAAPAEQGEGTKPIDPEMKMENVIDAVGRRERDGDGDVVESGMKQEQDDQGWVRDIKTEDSTGHGADKMEESESKVGVKAEESGIVMGKKGESDREEEESGSSSSEEEEEEEADIGKVIERRLLEIKRQKEKSNENGGKKEVQKGGNSEEGVKKQEQVGVVADAEMEEGEISD